MSSVEPSPDERSIAYAPTQSGTVRSAKTGTDY